MFVFIVRPFGTKDGIDFDKVQDHLITPALERLGLKGDTTKPIARAGNIRADMFQLLAKSDLVIADISIHNANVFYELGARHALRDKRTFLIRSRKDGIPFDLRTDRYLEYDIDDPGANVDALEAGLRQTLDGEMTDSPIFQLVPKLASQDWTSLVAVPEGFRQDVEKAVSDRFLGDLELLSYEAQSFDWAPEGLRLVGRAQVDLKAWEGARDTWEAVRERLEGDLEADLELATVYQKLGLMSSSDAALSRATASPNLDGGKRAEAYALWGSNEKARWLDALTGMSSEEKQLRTLSLPYLRESLKYYKLGFMSDLNHFYSGINALALETIILELAKRHPDIWEVDFDDEEEAERALEEKERERRILEGAVALSVNRQLEHGNKERRWRDITRADLALLTEKKPARVARAYQRALGGASSFYFESQRRQLDLYMELGIFTDNVVAVLDGLNQLSEGSGAIGNKNEDGDDDVHVLLFVGHRVDASDRVTPRFPPDREELARGAIRKAVLEEKERVQQCVLGIAGGANGGDLLFHEICSELKIPTQLYLAIPSNDYIVESVDRLGQPHWIDRFRKVERCCPKRILSSSTEQPRWLRSLPNYNIWQRNNRWMLHSALAHGGENVTLIALWNGGVSDGPGGIHDMVQQARSRGARVVVLDTNQLFEL